MDSESNTLHYRRIGLLNEDRYLPPTVINPLVLVVQSGGAVDVLSAVCNMSNIVQYIIVRGDLRTTLNWPLGAVIAQCCHATAAVMHLNADDDDTVAYLKDLDNMHKVVLEAKTEEALVTLSEKLKVNDIKHKLWIEQPENIPTCIAIKPYVKDNVHKYVKHLKLLK